jgi:hypothetical protein
VAIRVVEVGVTDGEKVAIGEGPRAR